MPAPKVAVVMRVRQCGENARAQFPITPLRVVFAMLALVICGWFALGIRQAHDIAGATSIVSGQAPLDAGQDNRVAALLRSAGALNPDAAVDVLRGRLALNEGHRFEAQRILGDVVRREPMNLEAWIWLGQAAYGNAQLQKLTIGNIARLDPQVAGGR
jgi:hypothetical protein